MQKYAYKCLIHIYLRYLFNCITMQNFHKVPQVVLKKSGNIVRKLTPVHSIWKLFSHYCNEKIGFLLVTKFTVWAQYKKCISDH